MLSVFRKFRENLLTQGKTRTYLKYALGEIILIVIGILIALQLQNWNEKRKQKAQFKNTLEQIYNAVNYDMDRFQSQLARLNYQLNTVDTLIENPENIPPIELPFALFSLTYEDYEEFRSETLFYTSGLEYNRGTLDQNELSREIFNYVANVQNIIQPAADIKKDLLLEFLFRENIPYPHMLLGNSEQGLTIRDSMYYNEAEVDLLKNHLNGKELNAILKTYRSQKLWTHIQIRNWHRDAQSILSLIKAYYPDVRFIYQDVGIIGTSIEGYDDVGALSTPLIQTDGEKGIWEIRMYLKEGTVKFRCRDSWSQNWGGITFPEGETLQDGPDIPVREPGNYHVILNLNDDSYRFIKIYDDSSIKEEGRSS